MSPKDCAYIVERLAIRFMALVADHERQLSEHRTSFGARTEADAKIIAGLRAEIDSLKREELATNETLKPLVDRVVTERDALRAEVAALQERLRASIARGDFTQMEVAATKSQTPKHPVKVGEWVHANRALVTCTHQHPAQDGQWVRRTVASGTEPVGTMIQVQRSRTHSEYVTRGGRVVPWAHCEPCDPPQTEPVPKRAHPVAVGEYLRRLTGFKTTPAGEIARVTLVDDDDPSQLEYEVVRPNGQQGRWSATGCEPCDSPEATHDTEEGKAVAESAVRTEPVAEEIKVGDVVKVVGASGDLTAQSDIGKIGEVLQLDSMDGAVRLSGGAGWVNHRDVRKVTT